MAKQDINDDIIPVSETNHREPKFMVYRIWKHPRATLDHVKYSGSRWKLVEDTPLFATMEKAEKYYKKLESEDKTIMYEARGTFIFKSQIPKPVLKDLKKLPWYKNI